MFATKQIMIGTEISIPYQVVLLSCSGLTMLKPGAYIINNIREATVDLRSKEGNIFNSVFINELSKLELFQSEYIYN